MLQRLIELDTGNHVSTRDSQQRPRAILQGRMASTVRFPETTFRLGTSLTSRPRPILAPSEDTHAERKRYYLVQQITPSRIAFLDCGSATAGSGAYRRPVGSLSNSPSNNLGLVENNLWQRGEISVLLECPSLRSTSNFVKSI